MESTHFGGAVAPDIVLKEWFILSDTARFETGLVRDGFYYWHDKCDGDRLPGRADIDPTEMPRLLQGVMLVDVLPTAGSHRLRFRLVGQNHVDIVGQNPTGKFLDEVLPVRDDAAGVINAYHAVITRKRPHYWLRRWLNPNVLFSYYERVVVPLASDGSTVDMLMSFVELFGLPSQDSRGNG